MSGGGRHRARIAVLQALYEADSAQHAPLEALKRIIAQEEITQDTATFAQDLIQGVLAQQDEIDRTIAQAAPAWPVKQLSPVDRNILRLAIWEMLGDNGTPVNVLINEAVELAKSFGSGSSARFINGVLGSVHRKRDTAQGGLTMKGRG